MKKYSKEVDELKQSNHGRYFGWFIEHKGKRIGELNHYEFDDMFWDRYTIMPYKGYETFLFNFENWLQNNFQYPNKHYWQCAQNAIFGMGGIRKENDKHTIMMRGLYLLEINNITPD